MSPNTISGPFRFAETEPTPLVKDFETFVQYLEDTSFSLGKRSGLIPYEQLAVLNQKMSQPNTENTPRTPQRFYPQLHLYYQAALAGKLFQKVCPKSNVMMEPTERLPLYRSLSPAEKYFFLLETIWVDCDWQAIAGAGFAAEMFVTRFLEAISHSEPAKTIDLRKSKEGWGPLFIGSMTTPFFIRCFSLFGWYDATRDEEQYQAYPTKRYFPVGTLTPSPVGVAIAKTLVQERPVEKWNLPYRRREGEIVTYPGLDSDAKKRDYVPFFVPFQGICKGELERTLPRKKGKHVKGNFVFKVRVAPKVWRSIAISSKHTLDSLHDAIQEAFNFDSDHLYAFFMDSRPWSDNAFWSPHTKDGVSADDVKIGDLGLWVNQSFLYLFDFGDEWRFEVRLLEIRKDEPLLSEPRIVEVQGKSPEQYRNYDEW